MRIFNSRHRASFKKVFTLLMIVCLITTVIPLAGNADTAGAAAYPEWNATTAYPANSIVTHNRATWQAKWYTVNEEPMDVLGNAWTCIIPAPPIPPAPAENPGGYDSPAVFFDDFNMYSTSSDQSLIDFGYEVSDRTGGPGPGGCVWSRNNVSFVPNPEKSSDKLLRLTATTNGQGNNTVQSELLAPRQFLYGTYSARVKFSDAPAYGADGDQVVQTFYTISPYTLANSTDYGEMDFEYLPNGGWGKDTSTMWNTTWDTGSDRVTQATSQSFNGWYICSIQCSSSEVKYYINGSLVASHSGKYVPTTPMFLSFNEWFIDGVWAGGSSQRAYIQDVDWVYYAKDKLMTPAQTEANVNYYRNNSVSRKDTVKNSAANNGPKAAILSADNPVNSGSYAITAKVLPNSAATSINIYEGSSRVLTQAVSPNSSQEQTFTYNVNGKGHGIYSYRADLSNSSGTTQSTTTTVQVTQSSGSTLLPASIGVDNANNTGNYTVTVTAPANNSATNLKLYETAGGTPNAVLSKTITPNSPAVQTFTYTAANKPAGTYTYRAELSNPEGNTAQSTNLTVTVTSAPVLRAPAVSADSTNNTGNYNITVSVPAYNSAAGVKLFETAGNTTGTVLDKPLAVNSSTVQTFSFPAAGKAQGNYTYRAEVADTGGNTLQSSTVTVTVTQNTGGNTDNLALGKSVTSSTYIANSSVITDADKATYNLAGVGEGLQWIQIDLGRSYNINTIKQWHYYGDGRQYHDVIVKVSNDPDFKTGVTTVFNNDNDNSAGFGAGTDSEYSESSSGKTINFNTVNARYVRLYVNGNNVNPYNHFVEVEVY